jgi:hypothetical protein
MIGDSSNKLSSSFLPILIRQTFCKLQTQLRQKNLTLELLKMHYSGGLVLGNGNHFGYCVTAMIKKDYSSL